VDTGGSETYVSKALDASYPDALNASSQLALGTLQLEGTENAVRPEQAAALLPLWQALRGGVTVQAEVNAVLKQIEGTMSQEQLAAIAAMRLTQEGLRTWMEEQGLGRPGGFQGAPGGTPVPGQTPGAGGWQDLSPEVRATRQAEFGDREVSPEMATRRAEFENMSQAEREALRATMQAGGGLPGGPGGRGAAGGTGGRGGGQFMILLNPLIELLTQRAAPGTTN
jgi:predicted pyridoxine 5'-phosphate oxidase superfamily flavin-nucleotide-binding protein